MKHLKLKFVHDELSDQEKEVIVPKKKSIYASGFDLVCAAKKTITIAPFERKLIPTGVAIELEPGFEAQVRARSGLALKNGLMVVNAPGTIDADYRGEICVILGNFSKEDFLVEFGMRIAQLVVAPVTLCDLQVQRTLSDSMRGEGGFGSTGV